MDYAIYVNSGFKLYIDDELMYAYTKHLLKKEIEKKEKELLECQEAFDNIDFHHDNDDVIKHFETALQKEIERIVFEINEVKAVLEYVNNKIK